MKICRACGSTFHDRVEFCFRDGQLLAGAPGVAPSEEATSVPEPSIEATVDPVAHEPPSPMGLSGALEAPEPTIPNPIVPREEDTGPFGRPGGGDAFDAPDPHFAPEPPIRSGLDAPEPLAAPVSLGATDATLPVAEPPPAPGSEFGLAPDPGFVPDPAELPTDVLGHGGSVDPEGETVPDMATEAVLDAPTLRPGELPEEEDEPTAPKVVAPPPAAPAEAPPSPSWADDDEEGGGGKGWMLLAAGVLLLVLVGGGAALVVGGVGVSTLGGEEAAVADADPPDQVPFQPTEVQVEPSEQPPVEGLEGEGLEGEGLEGEGLEGEGLEGEGVVTDGGGQDASGADVEASGGREGASTGASTAAAGTTGGTSSGVSTSSGSSTGTSSAGSGSSSRGTTGSGATTAASSTSRSSNGGSSGSTGSGTRASSGSSTGTAASSGGSTSATTGGTATADAALDPWGAAGPASTGELTIRTTPAGAMVFVDNREIGKSPVTTTQPFGLHTVRVQLPGYHTDARTVDMQTGSMAVPFELGPVVVTGKVNILGGTGTSGAELYIDQNIVGKLPATTSLSEGTHTFEVLLADGTRFSQVLNIRFEEPGRPVTVTLNSP